jgi:hypothetical protein
MDEIKRRRAGRARDDLDFGPQRGSTVEGMTRGDPDTSTEVPQTGRDRRRHGMDSAPGRGTSSFYDRFPEAAHISTSDFGH